MAVFTNAWAKTKSDAPLGSEYTKLNVWLRPLPDDGVTETTWGG